MIRPLKRKKWVKFSLQSEIFNLAPGKLPVHSEKRRERKNGYLGIACNHWRCCLFDCEKRQRLFPNASVPVAPSGDWAASESSFLPLTGTYPLYVTYRGTGAVDFDRFEIS